MALAQPKVLRWAVFCASLVQMRDRPHRQLRMSWKVRGLIEKQPLESWLLKPGCPLSFDGV